MVVPASVTMLLSLVSVGISAQVKGVHIGVQPEWVMLVGHWRSAPEDGPGVSAFAGYGTSRIAVRFGASTSAHHELNVVSLGSEEPDPVTVVRWLAFGDVSARLGRPGLLVAGRIGRMWRPHPGGWYLDAGVGLVLPIRPDPEVSVSVGLVRFAEENLPRTRYAGTVRVATTIALTLFN